jgi:hypothetical protein
MSMKKTEHWKQCNFFVKTTLHEGGKFESSPIDGKFKSLKNELL